MYQIFGGKRWENGCFVPNTVTKVMADEKDSRDVFLGDDDLITPGLVDFHAHLWSPATKSNFGVDEGRLFSQGIVAAQEPGSFGCNNWEQAEQYWKNGCFLKIRSFMHLLPDGLATFPLTDPPRPEDIDLSRIIDAVHRGKETGRLQGIKIHLGWLPYKDLKSDRQLLECARKVADATNTNIMVHISGQFVDAAETASVMKAGDVMTHIYSGLGNTVLDKDGAVLPEIMQAHERGVVFDIGAAGTHFNWTVFRKAYQQGLTFDTMGSDITAMSWQKYVPETCYHLYYFLSAMLCSGVERDDVFRALLDTPASYMGIDLDKANSCLVLKKTDISGDYVDGKGDQAHYEYLYRPELFLHNGKPVLDRRG